MQRPYDAWIANIDIVAIFYYISLVLDGLGQLLGINHRDCTRPHAGGDISAAKEIRE